MFTAALFTVAKTWRQPQCPSTDDWIKEMWYLYTTEHLSSLRKDEILPFVTTQRALGNIMLSEISQKKLRSI